MYATGNIHRDVEQGTDAWHSLRVGKVTASRIADMLAATKSGWAASRGNYRAELVIERLTGKAPERFKSAAMQFGTETEEEARNDYLFSERITDFETVAFIDHPTIEMAGCSPDLLVSTDGMGEIKCPGLATHIETLTTRKIPDKYIKQMQWQMACAGRAWCDFISFAPEMPPQMRLFKQRIERNNTLINEYEAETRVFLSELDHAIADLKRLYPEQN